MSEQSKFIPLKRPALPSDDSRMLVQLTVQQLREIVTEAVKAAAAGNGQDGDDRLLAAEEAAPILGFSAGWLYHNWKKLPFAKKLGPKGLRFSYRGIQKYIAARKA